MHLRGINLLLHSTNAIVPICYFHLGDNRCSVGDLDKMEPSKDLSDFQRGGIVGAHAIGCNISLVEIKFRYSQTTGTRETMYYTFIFNFFHMCLAVQYIFIISVVYL